MKGDQLQVLHMKRALQMSAEARKTERPANLKPLQALQVLQANYAVEINTLAGRLSPGSSGLC